MWVGADGEQPGNCNETARTRMVIAPARLVEWPLRCGPVPPLADCHSTRPETGLGRIGKLDPGDTLILVPAPGLAPAGSALAAGNAGGSAVPAARREPAHLAASGGPGYLGASHEPAQLTASDGPAHLGASREPAHLAASGEAAHLAASGGPAYLAASGGSGKTQLAA